MIHAVSFALTALFVVGGGLLTLKTNDFGPTLVGIVLGVVSSMLPLMVR